MSWNITAAVVVVVVVGDVNLIILKREWLYIRGSEYHTAFSRMIEGQVHQHPVRVPPDKSQPLQNANTIKFEKYVGKYCTKNFRFLDLMKKITQYVGLKHINLRLEHRKTASNSASDCELKKYHVTKLIMIKFIYLRFTMIDRTHTTRSSFIRHRFILQFKLRLRHSNFKASN